MELLRPDYGPRPHRTLKGALAAGAAVTNGTAVTEIIPVHGARVIAVRIKTTGAGTLSSAFVRPVATDGATSSGKIDPTKVTKYTTGNPSDAAVTGGTEAIQQVTASGEAYLAVTFTPSADGQITYVDVSEL